MAIMAFGITEHQVMSYSYQNTLRHLNSSGQADNAARAGLIDAINWFQRQPSQPVANATTPDAAFNPQSSTGDTIDPTVGLVKQFAISDKSQLWVRYEVSNVHDITDLRTQNHVAGEGLVWSLQSIGYVYKQADPSMPYNHSPNQVLATSKMTTEIRRLGLILPADAAVVVNDRSTVTLANNSQLLGGSFPGLVYYTGSQGPTFSGSGNKISASAVQLTGSNQAMMPEGIFTTQLSEIRLMADQLVSAGGTLPKSFPANKMLFVDGNATFNAQTPLTGTGLLIVNGDLTVTTDANTLFTGLIYVTGNATLEGPGMISGALVVGGALSLDGKSDTLTVQYDQDILNTLRQQIGQYRFSRSQQFVFSGGVSH